MHLPMPMTYIYSRLTTPGTALRRAGCIILVIATLGAGGCATTGGDSVWGQVVTNSRSSIKQKSVWVPLAAAAVFAATNADHEVSDWAIEHKPIFGSTENAADWADWLSTGLIVSAVVSGYAQRDEHYQPLVTDLLALGSAYAFSAGMKRVVGRTRPDGWNDLSFPSLHATSAFAGANITARNLANVEGAGANLIRPALIAFATASAWGRIEGARHYPSDVLAGAAIGNFFAGVANAFAKDRQAIAVSYVPMFDGGELRVAWNFR
ncbi:MAG: phosphatase PAP2 family protein [Gammaproteobacteria bacterium]|nr:phosphatase PAP2 family protein [Gammaproteobacteria bacterium]